MACRLRLGQDSLVAAPPLTIPRPFVLVLGAARGGGGTTTGLWHGWDGCRSVTPTRQPGRGAEREGGRRRFCVEG